MKKLLALALVAPGLALAASPFDGTWKLRVDSITYSAKPDVYELSGGMYSCSSCVPAYKIKADGTDQPVPGHEYRDHQSIKVVDAMTIETVEKKGGKVISKSTQTVSADGKTLTGTFSNYTGKKEITGGWTEKRIAAGPAGAHAISGSWEGQPLNNLSDAALLTTFQSTHNGMKISWNGQVTDAKFDGKEYPTVGDPGKTMVTLKKVSDSQIDETDRRSGKVYDNIVWKVSADGKTLSLEDSDPVHESKTSWVADKQK